MVTRPAYLRLIAGSHSLLLITGTMSTAFALTLSNQFSLGTLRGRGTCSGGSCRNPVSEAYVGGPAATDGLQVGGVTDALVEKTAPLIANLEPRATQYFWYDCCSTIPRVVMRSALSSS